MIVIAGPESDLSGQLAALPASFLDASSLLTSHCAARTAPVGSFVVRGAGWIPPPPDGPLGGFLSEEPAAPARTTPAPTPLADREPPTSPEPGACRMEARVRP